VTSARVRGWYDLIFSDRPTADQALAFLQMQCK
jgi:hypothetical protein